MPTQQLFLPEGVLGKRHNGRIEAPIGGHIAPPILSGKRGTTLGSITPFFGVTGPQIRNAPRLIGAGRRERDTMSPQRPPHLEAVRLSPVFIHFSSYPL